MCGSHIQVTDRQCRRQDDPRVAEGPVARKATFLDALMHYFGLCRLTCGAALGAGLQTLSSATASRYLARTRLRLDLGGDFQVVSRDVDLPTFPLPRVSGHLVYSWFSAGFAACQCSGHAAGLSAGAALAAGVDRVLGRGAHFAAVARAGADIADAESYKREIAERQRAEAALLNSEAAARKLAEADARKNEFLAMLGHELRNPLAPIRNAVKIMKQRGSDDPDLCWARDVVDHQVRQMAQLVDDLLEISRVTSGKVRLQKEAVDVATIVAFAIETSRPVDRGPPSSPVDLLARRPYLCRC